MSKLDKRLVLAEWLFHQIGFTQDTSAGMNQLRDMLKGVKLGWDEQNVFHFRRKLELSLPETRAISNDDLIRYDQSISRHWQWVVRKRRVKEHRELYPLHFQYLSLLFTEYFLDRWSLDQMQETTTLLAEVNRFRERFNSRFDTLSATDKRQCVVEAFESKDLTKLAFWIATGGGKTLLMHCHILQLRHYLRERGLERLFNKVILITPNDGLTEQHLEEFEDSGIVAKRFQRDQPDQMEMSYGDRLTVEITEITKLKDKTGVTTVNVAEFGKNNIVLVDEGHRGSGGDEWFEKRQQLCQEGFSFEYSATFGQSINALSGQKQKEMGQLYAKSILFDYSYKYFFGDGFGKDFLILNYRENARQRRAGEEAFANQHRLYLTACLLRFYQQCRLYKDKRGSFASYLLDDPLLVFVGGSVTGKKKYTDEGANEQNREETDVVQAVRFLAEFIHQETDSIRCLDLLLRQRDELRNDEGLAFRNAFNYVRELFPLVETDAATRLYQDILEVCFNAAGRGLLHAVHMKGSGSEIGLRVGEGTEYFGVINVGEPKKLWDVIQASAGESIVADEQEVSISLFAQIKAPGSNIRVLIGAKKFTEGWSCWRVSGMGLINVGKKEGSQIIQLFGRGVRLKGLDFGLKRSTALPDDGHPPYVEELETLNIFGIRADYMDTFREYIDEEDVSSERKTEQISLPTIENLARTDLKVILPRHDMPDFKKERVISFERNTGIRTKISADWYGRLESKTNRLDLHSADETRMEATYLRAENRRFLDYQRIFLNVLAFKKQNAMYNLEVSAEAVADLLAETDWYSLYIPAHMLRFDSFAKVKIWQEVATDLVLRYCAKFYNFERDAFEAPYQEYRSIQQILDAPTETYSAQFLRNLRIEYMATVEKSQEALIRDLRTIEEELKAGRLPAIISSGNGFDAGGMAIFAFDKHLYQPLIHLSRGVVNISVQPAALNKSERQFVLDLKKWCQQEQAGALADAELFLLRNQSRGRGISFFEEGNFYPDFIVWLIRGQTQRIIFVDPHGLRHARSFDDGKIRMHETIKRIERDRLGDPNVLLDTYILSPTRYSEISHWNGGSSKAEFEEHNVLFMYDDEESYVSKIFGGL